MPEREKSYNRLYKEYAAKLSKEQFIAMLDALVSSGTIDIKDIPFYLDQGMITKQSIGDIPQLQTPTTSLAGFKLDVEDADKMDPIDDDGRGTHRGKDAQKRIAKRGLAGTTITTGYDEEDVEYTDGNPLVKGARYKSTFLQLWDDRNTTIIDRLRHLHVITSYGNHVPIVSATLADGVAINWLLPAGVTELKSFFIICAGGQINVDFDQVATAASHIMNIGEVLLLNRRINTQISILRTGAANGNIRGLGLY